MIKLALIGGTLGLIGISGLSMSNVIQGIVVTGLGLFTLSIVLQLLATTVQIVMRWRARRHTDCPPGTETLSRIGHYSDLAS